MSRTYKHINKYKAKETPWDIDYEYFQYPAFYVDWHTKEEKEWVRTGRLLKKTVKPKQRKTIDTEYHWMTTPSWWTHLCSIKPDRVAKATWEKTRTLDNLDEPCPDKHKHEIYYW